MINKALYKRGIKSNYKFVLIFLAILTLYITIIVSMYNPKSLKAMEEFAKVLPEIMTMVGMTGNTATFMGYLVTYLYGFLLLLFPLIVSVGVAHSLVAAHVDKGSMANLLASPNSRKKIITTQILVLISIIFLVVLYSTVITIISSLIMFPSEIKIGKLLLMNSGLLALHLFIGSISFLTSTLANDSKQSLMWGSGITIFSFLMHMLSNMGGKLDKIKYITFFSLFQPEKILNGDMYSYIAIGVLLIMSLILFIISVEVFKKKDLSV